jgi:hypothetical protein
MTSSILFSTFYGLGMCLTYVSLSDFIRERLDEEELFSQQMKDPSERNMFEVVVLLVSALWIVTVPLLISRRRRK